MAQDLPPADPSSPWMVHLERAHALAHRAAREIADEPEPTLHLEDAAARIGRAVAAMYDAFDGRTDRITAVSLAHGRLWDAAVLVARGGLGSALPPLRDACSELLLAEERFPRVPLAPRREAELRGSTRVLPLHVIERSSLVPVFPAPPAPAEEPEPVASALPEPRTFEELAAVAAMLSKRAAAARAPAATKDAVSRPFPPEAPPLPPGFGSAPQAATSARGFVQGWARHCFEEIGMLGLQRTPLVGEPFRASLPIERRLLHAVDAIAALGPVALELLEAHALDAPAANPMTVFAMAMLAGCFEGRDLLGGAERVLHRFAPGDPMVAEPFVSAMKLAPNPFIPGMLRSLAAAPERGARPIAIEVLAARGWLSSSELAALAQEEDPRLFALALGALAETRHPDLDRALVRALAHPDRRVQRAGLDAMAIASHPDAASAARSAAHGELGDEALLALAIVADAEDARLLLDRALQRPTPASVEAVGWAGLRDAIPALLPLLASEAEGVSAAAAVALERLLGAGLVDVIEVPPDVVEDAMLLDPDPDPPRARPTLEELVSDPRDRPGKGSPEKLEVASVNPERWSAVWAARRESLDAGQRLRRGRPWSPSVSLYELDQVPLPPEDRRALHRELQARTARHARFDPHDLVSAQEDSLSAWSVLIRAAGEAPGSWARAHR